MASKKKAKTLDVLLEEARVPEVEQPYELPESWIWVKLSGFAECLDKFRKPINANERAKRLGDIPYYGATGQVGYIDDYLTDEHLVVLGEDGAPFYDLYKSKSYIIEGKAWVNNHAHLLKSYYGIEGNEYLNYYLNQFNYHGYVSGTTRLKLTQKKMLEIPVPLPPKEVISKIVMQIKTLFIKIENAKQLIAEAKGKILLEKAIYYKNTLSGKNLNNNERWKILKIEELIMPTRRSMTTGPFGTALKKTDYVVEGIPVLGIDSINNGEFIYKNKNFITQDKLKELTSYLVQEDDIIISRSGTVGELCIVPKKTIPAIISTNIIKLTLNKEIILPQFFVYMFLVEGTVKEQIRNLCKGSTREFLNQTILKSIEFPVPTIDEQEIIIEKMKNAINRFKIMEEFIDGKSLAFDKLKSSILSKAFKGELGTSDPIDESAIELLKSALQENL
ncbi:restriction endonuclease subunit S [Bacillus wiedmannii]|uniref:restriction endonuclease subunit S n=1 Tax=Bacillus wiedmannii TaxID=1890302 RepID=UPI0021CE5365|nr:restriction endonuclease subunit S [Bacillus wiedmannii]MCU5332149.1 restriction endonuclease subunit S [Bacillus wiedmannii]